MRCKACDKLLTDYESTRKSALTKEYLDLCNHCFRAINDNMYVKEREDLITSDDVDEDPIDLDYLEDL